MEQHGLSISVQLAISLGSILVSILTAYYLFKANTEKALQRLSDTKADKDATNKMEKDMAEKADREKVAEINTRLTIIEGKQEEILESLEKVQKKLDEHIVNEPKRKRRG